MAIVLYDLAGAEEDRRFSPYCWRTKMALKHKGLEFETVPWYFTEKDKIAFANSKTVPVITDAGTPVADSWNIAVYLDQAYPSRPGLLGVSSSAALNEFVNHWAFRALTPALFPVVIMDVFDKIHPKDRAYWRESREKRFGMTLEQYGADQQKKLAAFRAVLDVPRPIVAHHRFLCGNGPGYADYIVFGAFQWARCCSPIKLLEPDDPMYAWRERMLDLFDGYARQAKGFDV